MGIEKRKKQRLQGFNYGTPGTYFLTICSFQRQKIFGNVLMRHGKRRTGDGAPYGAEHIGVDVGHTVLGVPCAEVFLSEIGKIVDKHIKNLPLHYADVIIDNYVVMPNHIHILMSLKNEETRSYQRKNERIPRIVAAFKRFTNNATNRCIWQNSYHDHIIRDVQDNIDHYNYIDNNPLRWTEDKYYTE